MKIEVEDRQFGQVVTVTLDDGRAVSEPVQDDFHASGVMRKIAYRLDNGQYDPPQMVISRRSESNG